MLNIIHASPANFPCKQSKNHNNGKIHQGNDLGLCFVLANLCQQGFPFTQYLAKIECVSCISPFDYFL
jgi:uncharacterized CHY-type Zn-finger protein